MSVTFPSDFVTPPSSPRGPPVPPGAPQRDKSSEINDKFFVNLMKRFNKFLELKGHSILETTSKLNPEEQLPFSVQSVDRNDKPIVHDMELLAQYNRYTEHDDIQKLYSEFLGIGENFEVERLKRVFADIWANGTSEQFQHNPEYFLFGIIVRGFKDSIASLEKAMMNYFFEAQRQDQDEDEGF
jgi:hypothetical protein